MSKMSKTQKMSKFVKNPKSAKNLKEMPNMPKNVEQNFKMTGLISLGPNTIIISHDPSPTIPRDLYG